MCVVLLLTALYLAEDIVQRLVNFSSAKISLERTAFELSLFQGLFIVFHAYCIFEQTDEVGAIANHVEPASKW